MDREGIVSNCMLALAIACGFGLIVMLCWDTMPRRDVHRSAVVSKRDRLPPA